MAETSDIMHQGFRVADIEAAVLLLDGQAALDHMRERACCSWRTWDYFSLVRYMERAEAKRREANQ